MEDAEAISHSLNRLGNWFMNSDQPFFESLDDRLGLATTLDLLGMTSNPCGNYAAAITY